MTFVSSQSQNIFRSSSSRTNTVNWGTGTKPRRIGPTPHLHLHRRGTIFWRGVKTNCCLFYRDAADCSREGKQTEQVEQTRRKYVSARGATLILATVVRHPGDLVYTIVPPLPIVLDFCLILASPFRLFFLPSRPFFFLIVRPLQGEPLHSSKAVDRARSNSNLEQERSNATDNVNWWTGNWTCCKDVAM